MRLSDGQVSAAASVLRLGFAAHRGCAFARWIDDNVFALLIALNMPQAIGFILAAMVFIGVQALLLLWVMRRLRENPEG